MVLGMACKAAMRPSPAKLYLLGSSNQLVDPAIEAYNSGVYGLKPDAVLAATKQARSGLTARHQLYMGVRLGLNSVLDEQELTDIVRAIRAGGGDGEERRGAVAEPDPHGHPGAGDVAHRAAVAHRADCLLYTSPSPRD